MYFPNLRNPNPTCIKPASINTAKIMGSAFSTLPSLDAISVLIITILTAVIGAVGPEICVLVPPRRAAKKLKNIAPYKPAVGPNPEETPNAKAKGSATIPAVSPPKISPLM